MTVNPYSSLSVSYGAPQPAAPAPQPVSFELKRAGVTEFVTANGVRTELRLKIKNVFDSGKKCEKTGLPVLLVELDVEPSYSAALVVDPPVFDAPNPYAVLKPVGEGH